MRIAIRLAQGSEEFARELLQATFVLSTDVEASGDAESDFDRLRLLLLFAYRKHRRLRMHGSLDDCQEARSVSDGQIDSVLLRIVLEQILRRVRREARELLWLVLVKGHTVKEAADILGMSEAKAESIIRRAKTALRSRLDEAGWNPEANDEL